jgi:hypothetical protein
MELLDIRALSFRWTRSTSSTSNSVTAQHDRHGCDVVRSLLQVILITRQYIGRDSDLDMSLNTIDKSDGFSCLPVYAVTSFGSPQPVGGHCGQDNLDSWLPYGLTAIGMPCLRQTAMHCRSLNDGNVSRIIPRNVSKCCLSNPAGTEDGRTHLRLRLRDR